ncbi:MAG: GNAT family N-acetyltransferase [Acidobacteria bacterium]|nr:GNAT family N-acetyltransferase [Acidobacteriota bacterium]
MAAMEIRTAVAAEAATIALFNTLMAQETEAIKLDESRVLAGVRTVFDRPERGWYLVALESGEVVGQLMVTFEWSDWRNGVFWWIQSVYVKPEARGRGVYKALYAELMRRAREDGGVCGVRLYVEKHNQRAQEVYARQGMRRADYDLFEVDFVLTRP